MSDYYYKVRRTAAVSRKARLAKGTQVISAAIGGGGSSAVIDLSPYMTNDRFAQYFDVDTSTGDTRSKQPLYAPNGLTATDTILRGDAFVMGGELRLGTPSNYVPLRKYDAGSAKNVQIGDAGSGVIVWVQELRIASTDSGYVSLRYDATDDCLRVDKTIVSAGGVTALG